MRRKTGRYAFLAALGLCVFFGQVPKAVGQGEAVQTLAYVPPAGRVGGLDGFVRVVNHSTTAATVAITGFDDTGARFGPVDLALAASSSVQFTSEALEEGNAGVGLPVGLGDGSGDWRLEFRSTSDIEAVALVRTPDRFMTSVQAVVAPEAEGGNVYPVAIFNPGSNTRKASLLRLVNPGDAAAAVTIGGIDDQGAAGPGGSVRLTVPAGGAVRVTAPELEAGGADLQGRLGDGSGKWRLRVASDRPLLVTNLLRSLTDSGLVYVSNLSVGGGRGESPPPPRSCDETVTVEGGDRGTHSLATAISLGDLTGVWDVRAREGTVERTDNEDDYYRFTLTGPDIRTRTIRVELRNLTGNADLYLLNADGNRVDYRSRSTNGGIANESIVWTLDSPGTYFILVTAADDARGTIRYQLRYSNDSVVPGRRIESAFDLGDLTRVATVRTREGGEVNRTRNETCLYRHRYYRFTLTDPDADEYTMRVELRNLTGNADLYLLNADGYRVHHRSESRNVGTANESIVWTLASPRTYYILVTAADDARGTIGYQLRYSNDSAIPGRRLESAFDLGDLTSVATVRTREGEVNRTRYETALFHHNYYRFTLTDSDTGTRTVRVELRNLTGNADLYLLNADGYRVHHRSESRNVGTANESIVWTLTSPGTYYIQVRAADDAVGTIGYQLRYGLEGG